MKRMFMDFNTLMQDKAQGNRVTLGRNADIASGEAPALCPGEHVIAYDDEMEVRAWWSTRARSGWRRWIGPPSNATLRYESIARLC